MIKIGGVNGAKGYPATDSYKLSITLALLGDPIPVAEAILEMLPGSH